MTGAYELEILKNNGDGTLTKICDILDPYPLNKAGDILTFTKELSEFGQATFRVSTYDNILTQYGDVLIPHEYHLRIKRNGTSVWQGAIIDNPKRTSNYIEVQCAQYIWYLNKILINRSSTDPSTGTADGIYRIFNTGSMSTAVTDIINESITTWSQSTNKTSSLAGMTVGTVDNPDFPPNMTDNLGSALSGAWTFSTDLQMLFDFQSILYVLKSFGAVSYADYEITDDLVFNFQKFIGNDRHYDVNFVFNKSGNFAQTNLVDYNLPRLGQRMVNNLWGVATDSYGTVLFAPQSNQNSISTYGLLEGVAAYADVNDQGILGARTAAELNLISTPDQTNVIVVLNEQTAYPLGVWDVGDIVSINVQNNGVSFSDARRIVGCSVSVHNTGREMTTVQTNIVQPFQYGYLGG